MLLKLFKTLFMLIPVLFGGINKNMRSYDDMNKTYEIYPLPRSVTYGDKTLNLKKNINIVIKGYVDEATKEKAIDVLSIKPVLSKMSKEVEENANNLILATYASKYLSGEEYQYISTKIDAYYLEINENNIIVFGKNTDAIYYGLSTLQFIFEQSNNSIRTLKIKDYAQSGLRGFIEGYYGIPWTSEERKELMRFGSRVKSNIYVYAPKDDVYHSTSWRSLYSDIDYQILKEQVEVGVASKTRLAWAIHPFMNNPLTRATYSSDLYIIKQKFEQVYSAGVRQFVLSADDINMFSVSDPQVVDVAHHALLHRDLLNDLASWVKEKQGCYDLVFVPTTYNNTDEKCAEYFATLMDGLDESIQIMWTGQKVCSSMNNMAYDSFYSYSGSTKKPFIWMNWPVNDYAINYLLMGEGEVFNKKYDNDDDVEFSGLVVNPMQLAEASKLSIWACADYSWNSKDYDSHTSYLKSFKYIEDNKTDELMRICEHLTNTASKFEDSAFLEAESLKVLINKYKEAYALNNYQKEENDINEYLTSLIEACDNYLSNASNRKLVTNIRPWVNAVKYNALAGKAFLYLVRNEASLSDEELKTKYEEALQYKELMNSQYAPNLIPGFYSIENRPAYACTTVLNPFIFYLEDLIEDDICVRLGISTGIKCANMGPIYEGKLDNMVDNDESTYCWFGGSSYVGSYIRLDLVSVTQIKDVTIIFGNEDPNTYDRMSGVVQVSSDAKTWTDIGEFTANRNVIDIRDNPVSGRFIRFYCTKDDTHWVSVREIKYNTLTDDDPLIKYSGFNGIYEGMLHDMTDGNDDTYCWFSSNPQVGGYILIDYLDTITINDIDILFGTNDPNLGYNDKFTGKLQYSVDGVNFIDITNMDSLHVFLDLRSNPINARYLRMYAVEDIPGWVAVREVRINNIPEDKYLYTWNTFNLEEGNLDYLEDNDTSTMCHFSKGDTHNASITLDIRSVQKINKITYKQGNANNEDIIYFFKVFISSDKENWTQVGEDQYRDCYELNLDLSSSNISGRYIKIESDGDLITWVYISEFTCNR